MFAAGRQPEAAIELEAAQRTYVERGDQSQAALAMTVRAMATRHLDQMDETRALLAQAREILEAQEPSVELARLYTAMAGDAMLASRYPESRAFAEKALDLAEALDQPGIKVRALQFRGWARADAHDIAGAMADLQAAIETGLKVGEGRETAVAYNNYAGMRWAFEGPAQGLETYTEGIEFAARRGIEGSTIWQRAESTLCLYDLGRWDEVLAVANEIAAEAEARSWTQPRSLAQPPRILVLAFRGQVADAARLVTDAMPAARQVGDPQLLIPMLQASALVDVRRNDRAAAIQALGEIELITSRTTGLVGSVTAEIVRLAVAAGDLDLARRLLKANPGFPGRSETIVASGRAVLAEAEGRYDDALFGFRDAAERWAANGNVIEGGRALLGVGRCLVALGLTAEAVDPLGEARDVFVGVEAAVLVAEVDDLLAQTAARAG